VTFQEADRDRMPSALVIRIARIGVKYHPLFVRLSAPPPRDRISMVDPSRQTGPLVVSPDPTARRFLDDFLDAEVAGRSFDEVRP
jgi:hypothetical protein